MEAFRVTLHMKPVTAGITKIKPKRTVYVFAENVMEVVSRLQAVGEMKDDVTSFEVHLLKAPVYVRPHDLPLTVKGNTKSWKQGVTDSINAAANTSGCSDCTENICGILRDLRDND